MIHRILVGLDGSQLARSGLDHAAALARAFEAEIVLLRVLEPAHHELFGPLGALHWRLSCAEARAALDESAAVLQQQGLDCHVELVEGKPAEQIIDFARIHACDLIVLASHGERGVNQFRLGSTAHKIVSDCGLSILLLRDSFARATDVGAEETGPLYERIMVPLDCSARSEWALSMAASAARSQQAELLLVALVPTADSIAALPPQAGGRELLEDLSARALRCCEEYIEGIERRFTAPALRVRKLIRPSRRVAQTLTEIADSEQADLIVMCAHGSNGQAPWPYGSVSSRLIAHGSRPLLVFQDQAVRELAMVETVPGAEDRSPLHSR